MVKSLSLFRPRLSYRRIIWTSHRRLVKSVC